jgi:DNA repair protein SbcC/Rad50
MRIDSIELQNVGVFKSYQIDFGSGLIGITGPNGAGKTTLVNAIYAALTNDFSRLAPTKTDAITKGSDGNSYIKLSGSHHNVSFSLVRWLRPNKQELVVGDKKYTAAADINQFIEESLNVSKATIDNYVFVDQWEMFNFINQNVSERAKLFQHLCGITAATGIFKTCADYLTKHKNVEVIDNTPQLLQEMQQLKDHETNLIKEINELKENKLDKHQRDEYRAAFNQHAYMEKLKLESFDLKDNLTNLGIELDELEEQKKEANNAIEHIKNVLDSRQDKLKRANNIISSKLTYNLQYEKCKALQLSINTTQDKIDNLRVPVKPEDYLEVEPQQEIAMQLGELKHKIATYKDLVQLEDSTCPVCQQEVSDVMKELKYKEYKQFVVEHKQLFQQLKFSRDYDSDCSLYKTKLDELTKKQRDYTSQLQAISDNMPKAFKEDTVVSAESFVRKMAKLADDLDKHKNNYQRLAEKYAKKEGKRSAYSTKQKEIQEELATQINTVVYEKIKRLLEEDEQINSSLNKSLGRLTEIKNQLTTYKESYKKLNAQIAKYKIINDNLAVIERVKNVFHWNELPKSVAQSNLNLLVDDINEILGMFSNPFYIESDQDLSFRVFLPGKSPVSAKQLSGGQKVILAIAFRAALDKVFGHNIGMLFLDEPTSGLDADNVKYFHDTLKQLAGTVSDNRQLVMITHVHEFSDAFDQLITIEP